MPTDREERDRLARAGYERYAAGIRARDPCIAVLVDDWDEINEMVRESYRDIADGIFEAIRERGEVERGR